MKDLTNKRFGKLIVLEMIKIKGKSYCLCKCDCDNTKKIYASSLTRGATTSCGCYRKEKLRKLYLKHGMTGTRFWKIWTNILTRSTNPNHDYQKKKIKIDICKEWLEFENFKKDMYESYLKHLMIHGKKNTTIDRINNNLGYCKDNCKWATYKEQRINQNHRCDQKLIEATNIKTNEKIIIRNQRSFARKIGGNIAGIYYSLNHENVPYKNWNFKRLERSYYENKINKRRKRR